MEKTPIKKIDLLVGAFLAILFIVLSFQSFSAFESLGRIIFSVQMRLDSPRNQGTNVVAIVNIDDKSIKQLGPWPWPRQLIAEMIPILKNNGARLIALDLLFSEKERNLGLQEIRDLQKSIQERLGTSPKDPALLKSLSDIESRLDSDRPLIKAVKEGGIIYLPLLGSFGKYDSELVLPEDSFVKKNGDRLRQADHRDPHERRRLAGRCPGRRGADAAAPPRHLHERRRHRAAGGRARAGRAVVGKHLDKSVEELELSVRSYNCLKNANIRTIRELVTKSEAEMLKTKNFGRKSLSEIREILTSMGLSLGMKFDQPAPTAQE